MSQKDPTDAAWMQQQERSNMAILKLMVWISLTFGRRVGRIVLYGIAAYFVLFSPRARRASRDYLHLALNRWAEWSDGFRHVFSFASTIHDRIYLLNDRFDLFDIEIIGNEAVQKVAAEHPGARKINATLEAINPAATQDIIPLGRMDSMLQARDKLDEGYLVGMLADRGLGDDATVDCDFLGKPARFPLGPFRMAAMLRRPVFFMTGLYLGGNRYQLHFEPIADFSQTTREERDTAIHAAMQHYADRLTNYCRLAPYNWFNFFDFWQKK